MKSTRGYSRYTSERDAMLAEFVMTGDLTSPKQFFAKWGMQVPTGTTEFEDALYKCAMSARGLSEDVRRIASIKRREMQRNRG